MSRGPESASDEPQQAETLVPAAQRRAERRLWAVAFMLGVACVCLTSVDMALPLVATAIAWFVWSVATLRARPRDVRDDALRSGLVSLFPSALAFLVFVEDPLLAPQWVPALLLPPHLSVPLSLSPVFFLGALVVRHLPRSDAPAPSSDPSPIPWQFAGVLAFWPLAAWVVSSWLNNDSLVQPIGYGLWASFALVLGQSALHSQIRGRRSPAQVRTSLVLPGVALALLALGTVTYLNHPSVILRDVLHSVPSSLEDARATRSRWGWLGLQSGTSVVFTLPREELPAFLQREFFLIEEKKGLGVLGDAPEFPGRRRSDGASCEIFVHSPERVRLSLSF